jgi:hypothetical protein
MAVQKKEKNDQKNFPAPLLGNLESRAATLRGSLYLAHLFHLSLLHNPLSSQILSAKPNFLGLGITQEIAFR